MTINAGTLTVCFNVAHLVPCKLFCLLPFGKNTRSASSLWRLLVARFYCFFWRFFFFSPQCFVGVQTDRSRVEGRLTEPDVETSVCLSFLLLQHLPSIFYTTKKRIRSFLPHSKQLADRLETLCAQLWRPNQFPNKSVTKDNLIDLRVCLSSRRCLQSQEGDGRAGRRSNEHLIHHSGRDAPTGPL